LLDVMLIVAFISFVSAVALSRFLRINHGGDR
jgi:multisubunit Na+/H+ antiporter MnhF subunit